MSEMEFNKEQCDILRSMTPEQRIMAFLALCRSARKIKAGALRQFHPDWSESQLNMALRESFLHARS